jgi:type VI protein secretion system component VasF
MPADSPPPRTLSLLELCEPLFQYLCRLNRAGRLTAGGARPAGKPTGETVFFTKPAASGSSGGRGLSLDYAVVRSEVKALLEDIQQKSAADFRLASQAKKLDLPLIFFVDSLVSESRLPFAAQWNQNRLAYERNELAGDEAFFDVVEETLKETSEEAAERLAVFYLCMGLGFTGINFRQPEYLRRTMLAIAPRIRHYMDSDLASKICPETYAVVDTRNLVQPASNRLVVVGILFACFTLAVIVSYVWMYRSASSGLKGALGEVLLHDPAGKRDSK